MLFVAILEILVCVIILLYLLKRQAGERFSKKEIAKFIILGMLSTIASLFLNPFGEDTFFGMNPIVGGFLTALLSAALIEEVFKYVFFRIGLIRDKEVVSWHDAILACTLVGAGFTIFEGIEFAIAGGANVFRAFVPTHILLQIIMGYFYGKALVTKKTSDHILALAVPIAVHTIFDMFPIGLTIAVGDTTLDQLSGDALRALPNYNYMMILVAGTIVIAIATVVSLIVMIRKVGKWGRNGGLE